IAGSVSHSGQAAVGAKVVVKAAGERRRRRTTRQDGSFRFCRLRPGLDYTVVARHADLASENAGVYLDRQQLRVHVDLVLK
ncbi:MAG: carboxypeptidase regulatory-like domain-containing protein, partial [Candidatus Binatia bacterium]